MVDSSIFESKSKSCLRDGCSIVKYHIRRCVSLLGNGHNDHCFNATAGKFACIVGHCLLKDCVCVCVFNLHHSSAYRFAQFISNSAVNVPLSVFVKHPIKME